MELRSYRLVIESELDDHLAGALKGTARKRVADTTILTGPVRHQSDLQGC
jgi:hypothetical protein